jgi:hypothetical protein
MAVVRWEIPDILMTVLSAIGMGSWGRFSDHFFDKKELNDVAIFK